jgi:hypothetical protein
MEIGDFGIIVAKDFGSILSMNRDAQAQTLAALREVYDGSWTRLVGTDGGRSLHWKGKVGFVGGVTPTIDRHHAVMGAMGERFMLLPAPRPSTPNIQARRALSHAGNEKRMRARARSGRLKTSSRPADARPRTSTNDEITQLIALGTLVVRARSAVERDNYTREIELVPGSEAPTRLTDHAQTAPRRPERDRVPRRRRLACPRQSRTRLDPGPTAVDHGRPRRRRRQAQHPRPRRTPSAIRRPRPGARAKTSSPTDCSR